MLAVCLTYSMQLSGIFQFGVRSSAQAEVAMTSCQRIATCVGGAGVVMTS